MIAFNTEIQQHLHIQPFVVCDCPVVWQHCQIVTGVKAHCPDAVNDILLDFKAAICDSWTDISHQVSRIDMLLLHEQGHGFACDFLHGSLPATVNSGNDTGKGVI